MAERPTRQERILGLGSEADSPSSLQSGSHAQTVKARGDEWLDPTPTKVTAGMELFVVMILNQQPAVTMVRKRRVDKQARRHLWLLLVLRGGEGHPPEGLGWHYYYEPDLGQLGGALFASGG